MNETLLMPAAPIQSPPNTSVSASHDKPHKVAQIVFSLDPGGMENGVVNLANHLPLKEAHTRIICLERAGAFASRLRPEIAVSVLGRQPGWDWQACRRLARDLATDRPDVIHTHNLGPLIYAVVARTLAPSLWRVPILHGEHGALQGDSLNPRRLRQRKILYRFCQKVHTVSEGLRHELIERGFPAFKLVSVLNGVDCARFQPASDKTEACRAAGLPSQAFVLGAVGRFIATKRYPLLIEAFEIIAAQRSDLHLLILGDGGDVKQSVMERVSSSPMKHQIHAMGHQAEPAPFYQAMDLMVMPSSHEGLANALLEAMASGVPVLAHAACGAGEVIEHDRTGWLHEIVDASDLAHLLSTLCVDRERISHVGAAARKEAENRFSIDSMAAAYLRLFRSCASLTVRRS